MKAVVVGTPVSWDSANDRIVRGISSRKYAKIMRKIIIDVTFSHSGDIYHEHIEGCPGFWVYTSLSPFPVPAIYCASNAFFVIAFVLLIEVPKVLSFVLASCVFSICTGP